MSPAFKSFEKAFWEEANKRRLTDQNGDGLDLVRPDELIIRIFPEDEGTRLQEKLEALMKLARERWNDHHLAPPLRKIEVHAGGGRVLSRSEPTEEKAE